MNRKKSKKQEMNRPDGRKLNRSDRVEFAIVEGLEAFASRWNYRLEVVKMAKKKGAAGFLTGGRVDPVLAIPAINAMLSKGSNLPEGIATPQDWLATEKAKREQIKRENDEKTTMPIADAKRQNGEAWAWIFAQLNRLCNDYPPALAGGTAVQIFDKLAAFKKTMLKDGQKKFEEAA